MRLPVFLLSALLASSTVAAPKKGKKPAAAKKAPKVEPEPAPAPPPVKKSTVLLDTNPAAVAVQLEQALQEKFVVGSTDPALPEEIGHESVIKAAKKGSAVAVVTARHANGTWTLRTYAGGDGGVLAEVTFRGPPQGRVVVPKPMMAKLMAAANKAESSAESGGGDVPAVAATPSKTPSKPVEPTRGKDREKDQDKPSKPEPEKEAPPTERVESTPAPADDGERGQALRIGPGGLFLDRRFFYADDLFGALSRFSQPLAPSIGFEAELFPGAFVTSGIASYFGIVGELKYLVGVRAKAADGSWFAASALRVKASVKGRIPLGRLELGILFGYALSTYSLAGDPALKPNVPDVAYSALRPGLSLQLRIIGPLYVRAEGGYRILLGTGQLGSAQYFPRQTGGGMDVQAGLALRPFRYLEVRANFDYERHWFSMNPEPGDPYIAGGALDDARGFSLAAFFTL